jgi:uncharacterized protein (TIGR02246 family)
MAASSPEENGPLFQTLMDTRDLEGLVALYAEDAVLLGEGGTSHVGRDAIREYLKRIFEFEVAPTLHPVAVATEGDLAYERSRWTLTFPDENGKDTQIEGISVVVLRREADGEWRIAIDDPGLD